MSQHGKRTFPSNSGVYQRNKKPQLGPDFSDLPTHLPGSSTSFASDTKTHFPSSFIGNPPESNSFGPELSVKTENASISGENVGESEASIVPISQPASLVSIDSDLKSPQNTDFSKNTKNPAEPIFIEGTNISLQTEEDIAQWIAERRKKWPTRKNVEQKLQEQKATVPEKINKGPKQTPCKFFAKTGRCKFGSKCRNAHETTNNSSEKGSSNNAQKQTTSATRKMINGMLVNVPQRYKKEVNGAGSLFTKLVQRDLYEHENNVIIDFIQYLDSENLIDKDASFS